MTLNSNDNKKFIIFLQDIRPFDCVGFLELVQHTMESRHQTSRHYTMFMFYFLLCYLIKQYVCITVYLCFVFKYKIIVRLASRGLTRILPTGMDPAWA